MNMLSVITKTKILISKSTTGTTIGASMLFLDRSYKTNINYEILEHSDTKLLDFGKRWQKKISLHAKRYVKN